MRKHGVLSRNPVSNSFRAFLRDEEGQAVVEYVLMLITAISVVALMGAGLRRSLFTVWEFFAKQISAACPGCPPDPSVRF